MAEHLPWVEKYRPDNISEIKGHVDIMKVLGKYKDISSMPHLIFYGPPGTGKTSTILAMAKKFYGDRLQSMVMEINASDERGIDIVTGKIKSFVQTKSIVGPQIKLVLLDEADALTSEAQSALRRIIEKYTKTSRFCLCCNYSSKISTPIQSRCTRFRFSGIDDVYLKEKIQEIKIAEKITMEDSAIDAVVEVSNRDARRCINLLQSVFLGNLGVNITPDDVFKVAGVPLKKDIELILKSLFEDSFKESFANIEMITKSKGYAMTDIVTKLSSTLYCSNTVFMDEFSNIEYNLAEGGSEVLAIGHLVSCFHSKN